MEEKDKEIKSDSQDIEANKILAALSYVGIICFVPLFLKKNSKFTQFHAKQGLLLFIIEVVAWILSFIPPIGFILMVIAIIYSVLGIRASLAGKFWVLPIIGKYVSKLNI